MIIMRKFNKRVLVILGSCVVVLVLFSVLFFTKIQWHLGVECRADQTNFKGRLVCNRVAHNVVNVNTESGALTEYYRVKSSVYDRLSKEDSSDDCIEYVLSVSRSCGVTRKKTVTFTVSRYEGLDQKDFSSKEKEKIKNEVCDVLSKGYKGETLKKHLYNVCKKNDCFYVNVFNYE